MADTEHDRAETSVLATILARQAAQRPDQPALIGEGGPDRTWREVELRTRNLAHTLVRTGVRPGDRVAVARIKGTESFEAVHAILRAGAVVVPVDPLAPAEVAAAILADAEVAAVIGDRRTISAIDPWAGADLRCVIVTDPDDERMIDWDDAVAGNGESSALPAVEPDHDAYIIYTSGTTGIPKGIVHTHRSAMAYAITAADCHGLSADDRVAGMSPLHFDMSTLELYAAPLVGATVVPMSEPMLRLPASFAERSASEGVTVWYTVPFFLRQLTERGALDRRDLTSLRQVAYGGEPYPPGALAELRAQLPEHVRFMNVYGPAEVNACTIHELDAGHDPGAEVPIGRPWPAAEVRIVDDAGQPVRSGTPGELQVSATTLMRGYWRRPELTADRLTPRADGPAWYATGDLVVEDDEGRLWFRGRLDHQVKVRGVRLELEAIERVLTDAPGVAHAVAGLSGDDPPTIAAAVVPRVGIRIEADQIVRHCAGHLPVAAVPRRIEQFDTFPSTRSGKIDRRRVREVLAGQADEGSAEG